MIIDTLSIGLPKKEVFNGREFITGICKTPVSGLLRLGKTGFEGDGVGDPRYHGGPNKAVCVYSREHYSYWEEVLGIGMPMAAFGENLTVTDLREEEVCVGDIFGIGTAVVQVSQPRQPCATLAARLGREDMVQLVKDSGRTGFYLRVLEEGMVEQGNALVLRERDARGVTVSFTNRVRYHERDNREGIEKILSVPALSESWHRFFLEVRERGRGGHGS
ncbi:MAG: MOSC domain-containing protein [Alphaproteobacteria bacterium]|uniref:MOSC domain-containing protein n=1 Tax=Candidatus Nitrobium versatile TaxID=2884831 RepID=A0A953M3W2_9BACT|nr:MOSC domain-containing protein [Candidatus Nitrobium versatile]